MRQNYILSWTDNDGEQTASVVIPTPSEANEIIFTSDEAATVNIEKYEITFN